MRLTPKQVQALGQLLIDGEKIDDTKAVTLNNGPKKGRAVTVKNGKSIFEIGGRGKTVQVK